MWRIYAAKKGKEKHLSFAPGRRRECLGGKRPTAAMALLRYDAGAGVGPAIWYMDGLKHYQEENRFILRNECRSEGDWILP
jgi:hypothetical protein